MNEQQVREAIDALIEHNTKRINELQNTGEKPELVGEMNHAIDTLIHLKHNLRLCGCLPEAYEKAGEA